jgi:hypothetical protein
VSQIANTEKRTANTTSAESHQTAEVSDDVYGNVRYTKMAGITAIAASNTR